MLDLLFILISVVAVAGGIGMISFKQPINSALSFIVTILCLAGLYALLNAPFIFMAQIIVYAGAVITLLLFIIMFLNIQEKELPNEKNRFLIMVLGGLFLIPLNLVVYEGMKSIEPKRLDILQSDFGSIEHLGSELFSSWILPFELISILLLVALVGAVVLAKKEVK